jgi:hypothetical protein
MTSRSFERGTDQTVQVQLLALFPHSAKDGEKYLASLDIPLNNIRQVDLKKLNATGTPTLLLVNQQGVVTDEWIGKLSTDKETEVLSKLQ